MKATEHFAKLAGQQVRVMNNDGYPLFMYVLAEGDLDEAGVAEFMGDTHPKGALEAGWTVVAIEGEVEDNEVQGGDFIAVHDDTDKAYLCTSGTVVYFRGPASEIAMQPGHD